MAEGARLESVYTATYRGFESLPHRQIKQKALSQDGAFCFSGSWQSGLYPVSTGGWTSPLGQPKAARRASARDGASQSRPSTKLEKPTSGSVFCFLSQPYTPLIPVTALSLQLGDIGDISVLVLPGQPLVDRQLIRCHLIGIQLLGRDRHAARFHKQGRDGRCVQQ